MIAHEEGNFIEIGLWNSTRGIITVNLWSDHWPPRDWTETQE